jgi:hypothetical protein
MATMMECRQLTGRPRMIAEFYQRESFGPTNTLWALLPKRVPLSETTMQRDKSW